MKQPEGGVGAPPPVDPLNEVRRVIARFLVERGLELVKRLAREEGPWSEHLIPEDREVIEQLTGWEDIELTRMFFDIGRQYVLGKPPEPEPGPPRKRAARGKSARGKSAPGGRVREGNQDQVVGKEEG